MSVLLRKKSVLDQNPELALEVLAPHFRFDDAKGVALLSILLREVGGSYNYMALLKLVYFADRFHLREYGRPVSGDEYVAMKLGPVPSNLLRLVQSLPGDGYDLSIDAEASIDLTVFSKSDLDAVEFTVMHFSALGRDNPFALAELTHAYPEWDLWRDRFQRDAAGREPMDYRSFLENADPHHPVFRKRGFHDPFKPLDNSEKKLMSWQWNNSPAHPNTRN